VGVSEPVRGGKTGNGDELAAGPLSAEEVARRVGVDADALFHLMRALAGKSVLSRQRDGRFSLAAMGQSLRSDVAGSMRNTILFAGYSDHWQVWGHLLYSVQTGKS